MFLKSGVNDISDDEFNLIISPHGDKVNLFVEEYVMPEVIAFYLATVIMEIVCMRRVCIYISIQ